MFCFLNRESRKHSGRSGVGQVDEDIKSRVFFCLPGYFKQTALPEKSARLFFCPHPVVVVFLLFSLSLETHVTVTRCSRPSTSAGPSVRTCWPTKRSRRRRRTCSHAWPTSSTPSPRRRRKWASSRPRSSSRGCGRKTVTHSSSCFSSGRNPLARSVVVCSLKALKHLHRKEPK